MRHVSILLALFGVLGVGATAVAAPSPTSETLDKANRSLEGRRAIVVLEDGRVLRGVRSVVLGPVTTEWEFDGEKRQIATAEVEQVALAKSGRVKRWARRGLVAGAALGAIGFGYSDVDGAFVGTGGVEDVAAGALAGAALGAGAAALAGENVVFEAGSARDGSD